MVLVLVMVVAGFFCSAQYAGYSLVGDLAKFSSEFSSATQKTQSIRSNFTQEKNLSMLAEKIVSKGRFWFKKDNLVRMEYDQPFQYLMVINKDKVYVKDGQKENKLSTRSNKLFQQVNKVMTRRRQFLLIIVHFSVYRSVGTSLVSQYGKYKSLLPVIQ